MILPHMYMIFVILQYPRTFQHFWDHTQTSQALRFEFFVSAPTSSKILSSFFVVLTAEHLESSAPSRESYIQLPHPFCSTANNGCKAQQKLFGASKRNILAPSSFSNSWSMHLKSGEEVEYSIRFARRSGKLEMLRGPNHKKRRKCLWRSWSGHKEFEAKGLRGSRMIPKVLKSSGVL